MIIAIVTSIMIGAFLIIAALIHTGTVNNKHTNEPEPEPEQTKLLTVGCSVKYHDLMWRIKQFMEDSERQTVAVIEGYDEEGHVIRRTMVPVEELEGVEE